jgi:hypothetical protein
VVVDEMRCEGESERKQMRDIEKRGRGRERRVDEGEE